MIAALRWTGALVLPLLVTTSCFPDPSEPELIPPLWEGPWGEEAPWAPLAIRATPSHGNTHTAEVSVYLDGDLCGHQLLTSAAPSWKAVCGRRDTEVEIRFVPPDFRCLPGGVYIQEGSVVDFEGVRRNLRHLPIAAWTAEGEERPADSLEIEAAPRLLNAEVSAWPGNSEDLSSWRRWAFALPYHARTPAEGCTQRILGELESIPASKELDSRPTLPLRFRQLVLPVDRVSELLR